MNPVDPTLDVNASVPAPDAFTEAFNPDVPQAVESVVVPTVESADVNAMLDEIDATDLLTMIPDAANVLGSEEDAGRKVELEEEEDLGFTLEDLFGEALRPEELDETTHPVLDPVLFDTTRQIEDVFHGLNEDEGAALLEDISDAVADRAEICERESMIAAIAGAEQELAQVIGDDVDIAQLVATAGKGPKRLKFLYASVPEQPAIPKSDSLWLLDLPKVEPNRQVLHVEPEPFTEATSAKHSDERRLYTPHNVIRWTYSRGSKECLSNARLVVWSDGSTSLQVGKDLYDVVDSQEAVYNMIAVPTVLSSKGHAEAALIAAVHPEKHLALKLHSAKNTIDHTLVHEGRLQRAPHVTERLALAERLLPEFVDKKAVPSAQETYAIAMREQRRRRMRNEPMTLTQQFEQEFELFDQLHHATAQELEEQQKMAANSVEIQSTNSMHNSRKGSNAQHYSKYETTTHDALGDDEAQLAEFLAERNNVTATALDEPVRKVRRLERTAMTERTLAALTEYARHVPVGNAEAQGSVGSFVTLLSQDNLSDEMIAREVPKLIRELRSEHQELLDIPYQPVLDAVGFTEEL